MSLESFFSLICLSAGSFPPFGNILRSAERKVLPDRSPPEVSQTRTDSRYTAYSSHLENPGTPELLSLSFAVSGNSPCTLPHRSSADEASVYKGYKRDKIEMRGDRAEMSDFPLYLNTVAGGLDCRNQAIGGFSFVVKIYALPVVEIIGKFLYLLGRYGFDAQIGYGF